MKKSMQNYQQMGKETNTKEDSCSEAPLCLSKLARVARDAKKAARELRNDGNSRREEVELSPPRTKGGA